jgi:hypothetical protein
VLAGAATRGCSSSATSSSAGGIRNRAARRSIAVHALARLCVRVRGLSRDAAPLRPSTSSRAARARLPFEAGISRLTVATQRWRAIKPERPAASTHPSRLDGLQLSAIDATARQRSVKRRGSQWKNHSQRPSRAIARDPRSTAS